MTLPVKPNQIISLTIHNLGHHGEGIGLYQGLTIFVDGALPGECVEVKIIQCQKRYARGQLLRLLEPSPDRVQPICPLFERCGGCQLMHLTYSKQLEMKRQRVVDALERIGQLKNTPVAACLASPSPLGYRNKIQLPVRQSSTGIILGLYARGSHDLVEVEHCFIHSPLGEIVFQEISKILKRSPLTAFDPHTGNGELRHVLIKSAMQTEEALVILVTNNKANPTLVAVAQELLACNPVIKGVIHNWNEGRDNVILGQRYQLLAGSSFIHEKLCGLIFKISPASFFQVNPKQAENLYTRALTWAELSGAETVIDAYCGVGTLSLIFSKHAKTVIGIECIPEAIADAKENAGLNAIDNVEFICGDVKNALKKISQVDVVLLNPPRQGCEPEVLAAIGQLHPRTLIYISCDPATLARDLAKLCEFGYRIDAVEPLDMFPQTAHVETVVKCSSVTI